MINNITTFFKENKNIAICFILEDIDYYVETTKQVLLYKILDMFTTIKDIKLVFIATSVKMDITNSFEKRIKSRFSHRQLFFYKQSLNDFYNSIDHIINGMLFNNCDPDQRQRYHLIQHIF